MIDSRDIEHLRKAIGLAREAVEAGDEPFGSVLVDSASGQVLQTDRNRIVTGAQGDMKPDATLHPEFTLARWAQLHLPAEQRARSVVYTSGEHCPMCAAAHAYCGLGRIVYASSTEQYGQWRKENGVDNKGVKVAGLPINVVAPGLLVEGPVAEFAQEIRDLHVRNWTKTV